MHTDTQQPIPWCIMVSPEFTTEQGRITLRQWITEPEAKLRALDKTRRVFSDEFGMDPIGRGVSVSTPSYLTVHIIGGAELITPEDHFFMIRGHALASARDVDKLVIPDSFLSHPAMVPYVLQYEWLKDQAGENMPVGLGAGTQGPVTMAKLLRGQDFFADIIEHPEQARRLLGIVTEAGIQARREVKQFLGQPLEGASIAVHDDFAGLMGPAHFGEFAVPCYRRIYDAFKPELRLFHSELLRPAHLRYLEEMRIDYLNLGENQYMNPADVRAATAVPFEWHVKTATVAHGTPAMVSSEYEEAVANGAPAMVTQLCARNMPFENIHAFIAVARKHGPAIAPGGCYAAAIRAVELASSG